MTYVEKSGGIFMDMMIHDFDMVRYLSGSEVTEVYAAGGCLVDSHFADYGDVDTADGRVSRPSGSYFPAM